MFGEPASGGIGLGQALRGQRAIGIGLTGRGGFGMGMTQQDEGSHGLAGARRLGQDGPAA